MRGKILLTNLAKSDLAEIWCFTAEDNEDAANRFLEAIQAKGIIIASNPEIGRLRPELAPSLRSFPVEPYVLFYEAIDDGILVVRVLHGARDVEAIF